VRFERLEEVGWSKSHEFPFLENTLLQAGPLEIQFHRVAHRFFLEKSLPYSRQSAHDGPGKSLSQSSLLLGC